MAQGQGTSSTMPPVPTKGDQVLAWAQKFTVWARKNTALPGAGLVTTQTEGGRTFNAKPSPPVFYPPWWPTLNGLEVLIRPGAINSVVPRLTWADSETELGKPDSVLTITGGSAGLLVSKCTYGITDAVEEVTFSISTTGLPGDVIDSYFYVATHTFYTFQTVVDGPWLAVVFPLYYGSLQAVRCGDFWRW